MSTKKSIHHPEGFLHKGKLVDALYRISDETIFNFFRLGQIQRKLSEIFFQISDVKEA